MGREKTAGTKSGDYRYRFQYVAKLLCAASIPGTCQTSSSILPGGYQTVVSIHNPNRGTVMLRRKIAIPGSGQVSRFVDDKPPPDEVTKVGCARIGLGFGMRYIHGAEGFLVIESAHRLDVVAIYTAREHGGQVTGIAVNQVPDRRIR